MPAQLRRVAPPMIKLRRGLYRLALTHEGCGGELRVERCGSDPAMRWETWCVRCLACDMNGWPTLAEAVAQAAAWFGPNQETSARPNTEAGEGGSGPFVS